MLKRKWYWPLGLALLVHLVILGVIVTKLSYSLQKSEPEYMEVTLAELFSPPEPVNSADAPQQPSAAAGTNKFATNRSVANQSSPQPMIGSGAAATNGDTAVNAPVNMGNGSGNPGNGPGDTVTGSTGEGSTESPPGPAGSSKPPGATRAPRVVSSEEPDYPDVARQNGWRGTVKLRVLVSEQGVVEDVQVIASSGYSQLDQAALISMRNWQFSPALKEGRLVAAWVAIPVTFKLQ